MGGWGCTTGRSGPDRTVGPIAPSGPDRAPIAPSGVVLLGISPELIFFLVWGGGHFAPQKEKQGTERRRILWGFSVLLMVSPLC